jgi:uncharacterized protein
MDQLLALFPLHTVLFPGATLPLQIFEPRYKLMIGRCLELRQPFGVVLIREGSEVGGPAEPYDVGTTAAIQNVLRLEGGLMLLSAVGEQRFRIEQIVQREPYMVARVAYLEDEVTPEAREFATEIRQLYAQHRDALAHATGIESAMDELPDDPQAISYQISAQFHVVDYSKQQLLEADLDERLAAIVDALQRELALLPRHAEGPPQTNAGPWSLN